LTTATGNNGRVYNIKKVDSSANVVTIAANAADLIDGAATDLLTAQYQVRSIHARAAGNAWNVI
jgi:hypothetical protein